MKAGELLRYHCINDTGAAIVLIKAGDRNTADGRAIEVLMIGGAGTEAVPVTERRLLC